MRPVVKKMTLWLLYGGEYFWRYCCIDRDAKLDADGLTAATRERASFTNSDIHCQIVVAEAVVYASVLDYNSYNGCFKQGV